VRILKNLVSCLVRPRATLLIQNIVVPPSFTTFTESDSSAKGEGNGPALYGTGSRVEALARTHDIAMLQLMDGAERDRRALLAAADPRLDIINMTKPEGGLLSLLEVKLRGLS